MFCKFGVPDRDPGTDGTFSAILCGTLQQNVIADPFNPANTQACNYTHDDLVRLASVTCTNNTTNVWAQTFGYDPLGNLSKFLVTGYPGVSFTPTYSTSTNRITSAPFTCDANGNSTQDNGHSYTWDAEGKPVTLDSVGRVARLSHHY